MAALRFWSEYKVIKKGQKYTVIQQDFKHFFFGGTRLLLEKVVGTYSSKANAVRKIDQLDKSIELFF